MSYKGMKYGLKTIEQLERELHLKQLQVNRLLNITQAINSNIKVGELFEMYSSFLSWEMGVKKMALFFRQEDQWLCTAAIGLDRSKVDALELSSELMNYTRPNNLSDSSHPFIKQFDVVVPVRHKEVPLAYVFLGGFGEDEDMYSKVQFITTITNIITVAIENKRLFKQQLEQQLLQQEMMLASEMQQLLIPEALPSNKYYELAGIYKPHLNVGGDYYDYIQHKDGKLTFCIADIAGKGVAAALLMSNFQANFHSLLPQFNDLREFVKALNQAVLRITKGERFLTFFVAQYDPTSRMLEYVNAGHIQPALVMAGKVYRLKEGTTILGTLDELPFVEKGAVHIQGPALILLSTDGLSELRNESNEFIDQNFGDGFILKHANLSAEKFNERLLNELDKFKGKARFQDDFTVLTCKIF